MPYPVSLSDDRGVGFSLPDAASLENRQEFLPMKARRRQRTKRARSERSLAPRPAFAIRSQDYGCRAAQADDRIGSEWDAHKAPVQAKDPKGAENECDPP